MSERSLAEKKQRTLLAWALSALIGALIAWVSSAAVLPLIFGIQRKDSASLWMLSGAADLVFGFLCIPAFLIAHSASFAALKNADTAQWRAFRSTCQGILFFWIVLVFAWGNNGPVMRGN